MYQDIILILIVFITSSITAIVGLGGGMILIVILPSFFPIHAVMPIHGVAQASSNLSRAAINYKHIEYKIIPKFFIGSILGIIFFAMILYVVSLKIIPFLMGIYIILSLWSDKFNNLMGKYENYYLIGFLQTGLSLIVGAAGPLSITVLYKHYKDKNIVIATHAALMSITHSFKVIVFIFFGFIFWDYIEIIILIICASVTGSYIGTKLKNQINNDKLNLILKILITALALKLIYDGIKNIYD